MAESSSFSAKARELLKSRLLPALDRYDYPPSGLARGEATTLIDRLETALAAFDDSSDVGGKISALNEVINVVGTQSTRHSLYGGAGGSTDETNPGNPLGQEVSSAADAIRYQARKELKALRKGPG